MSAGAADVMNRDRSLDPTFEEIESDLAQISYIISRMAKAYRQLSPQAKGGRGGQELHDLIGWCLARKYAMAGELFRLRQAED